MSRKSTLLIIVAITMAAGGLAQEAGQTYRLTSVASPSRSLFVKNSSLNAESDVVAWTETDVPAQQWTLQASGDEGTYCLVNVLSGQCLARKAATLSTSANLVQTDQASDRAEWKLTAVAESPGEFIISPAVSGGEAYAISSEATSDGSQVRLARIDATSPQQQWTLSPVSPWDKVSAKMREEMMADFVAHFENARASELSTLGEGGGWGDAEMLETILDAFETTGDESYSELFGRVYGYMAKYLGSDFCKLVYDDNYKWYGHEFNDDVMWLVIAMARAAILTGQTQYQTLAKSNFNKVYKRGLLDIGTMRWKEGNGDGTNSCINCPTVIAACYIAKATGDGSYYEKARSIYMGQRARLYNPADGHVFDSTSADSDGKYSWNTWASTYNQGTFIGAALLLYEHYREPMFAADASLAFDYMKNNLCDSNGIINVCQTVSGDLCGFKGILMRYVRRLTVDLGRTDAMEWLQKNAIFAFSNRNADGITSSAWLTKSGEDYLLDGQSDTDFSAQPFGCSTAVSAVFNAPIDISDFKKDPYAGFEAEKFNYMKGMTVVSGTAGDNDFEVGGEKSGHYLCYANVDFGQQAANRISLRLSLVSKDGCEIDVYADSLSGQLLGTLSLGQTTEWQIHTADISPIEGNHAIYLRFHNASTATSDLYHIDRIQFSSSLPAFTASIMARSGRIEASESADDADEIIDSRVSTGATISANVEQIVYTANSKAAVRAYGIAAPASSAGFAPTAWTLEGSADGADWTLIDSQTGQLFGQDGELKVIELKDNAAYNQFRLTLSNADSEAESMKISEWQLFGQCLSESDITSDGGSFTTSTVQRKVYKAKNSYFPTAYSITVADGTAPANWTLEASADGKNWDVIDTRSGSIFRYSHSTQFYDVASDKSYSSFRLTVEDGDADDFRLQLYGNVATSATLSNGILSSGGEFTTSDGQSADALRALTDHSLGTCVSLPFSEDTCYLQYKAPMQVKVLSFGVTGGALMEQNPRSVELHGSTDGQTWTKIAAGTTGLTTKGAFREIPVTSAQTYNYFRLKLTKLYSSDQTEAVISEWQLNGTAVSQDWPVATPSKVVADGAATSASENEEQLSDGAVATTLCYQCFVPSAIVYDFSSPTKANVYAITAAPDNESRDPSAWTLQGSDDEIQWTMLDRQANIEFGNRSVTQFYPFDNSAAYRYYRLQIDAIKGNSDFLCQIAELQFGFSQTLADGIEKPGAASLYAESVPAISYDAASRRLYVTAIEATEVGLFDSTGRQIAGYSVGGGRQTISLSDLSGGLYIATAISASGMSVRKILL